jgi:hypothetical protein
MYNEYGFNTLVPKLSGLRLILLKEQWTIYHKKREELINVMIKRKLVEQHIMNE